MMVTAVSELPIQIQRVKRFARKQFRTLRSTRITDEYLTQNAIKKLQVGCGKHPLTGWLNADIDINAAESVIYMDATKRFPLPSNTFDYIYSEHVIEHIPVDGQLNMLRESFRVLKPGGVIRISTPDVNFLIDLYRGVSLSDVQRAYLTRAKKYHPHATESTLPLYVLNNFVRDWGHTFIHDERTLTELMQRAGFAGMTRERVGQSEHAALRGLEFEDRLPNGLLQLETMTIEARKP